jgi:hypothetical protein
VHATPKLLSSPLLSSALLSSPLLSSPLLSSPDLVEGYGGEDAGRQVRGNADLADVLSAPRPFVTPSGRSKSRAALPILLRWR